MTDTNTRLQKLFADRPTGQRIRVVSRGTSVLGDKPVTLIIEQELPDNVEAREGAIRQLAELVFHTAFGEGAHHTDTDGEPADSLLEAHVIEIEGDADDVAATEAREEVNVIMEDHAKQAKQDVVGQMVRSIIRPDDINPN